MSERSDDGGEGSGAGPNTTPGPSLGPITTTKNDKNIYNNSNYKIKQMEPI